MPTGSRILTPESPAKVIAFNQMLELSEFDGVTAVLRMTPFDTEGNMGHPAFREIRKIKITMTTSAIAMKMVSPIMKNFWQAQIPETRIRMAMA